MGGVLQRDIPVLASRVLELFVLEHCEGATDSLAGDARHDDVVDETTSAGQ